MKAYFYEAETKDVDKLLSYLQEDIENCLYIYIDLYMYGISNTNMNIWIGGDKEQPEAIVMKYHDSFQIYTRTSEFNIDAIMDLINLYTPQRVSGNVEIMEKIIEICEDKYDLVRGSIFKLTPKANPNFDIENLKKYNMAKIEDIPDIVELFCSKDIFGELYNEKDLADQLKERYESGVGRGLIARHNNKVIAHVGTFAETKDIAIISGAAVVKEFRTTDIQTTIADVMFEIICNIEKKDAYFMITNKRHINYYRKICQECTEYIKIVKK